MKEHSDASGHKPAFAHTAEEIWHITLQNLILQRPIFTHDGSAETYVTLFMYKVVYFKNQYNND